MRVLLVHNDIGIPKLLEEALGPAEVTVVQWDTFRNADLSGFDFAVLSGSSRAPVVGNENDFMQEFDFIRMSKIPLLGICFGFELIVTAFGGTLKMLSEKEQGVLHITIDSTDPIFAGVSNPFVYEGHRWVADQLPQVLIPLAHSPDGIQAVKHANRLIYGLQFHPEKLERETDGKKILENFINVVISTH